MFANTEDNEATKATEDTELTITRFLNPQYLQSHHREDDFVGSSNDIIEEINIFKGQNNRLMFEQVPQTFML